MRWLTRAALAVFTILFLAYFGWRMVADRRLGAEVARIQAAGEPLLPADFHPPQVADADNAALLYEAAAADVCSTGLDESILTDCLNLHRSDTAHLSTCGALVAAHAEALVKVRAARARSHVAWSVQFNSPLIKYDTSGLKGLRNLAKLLVVKAVVDHHKGDDAAVVQDLLDSHALADAIGQQPPLIAHLVGLATGAISLDIVEAFACELAIDGAEAGHTGVPAPREAVRDLIAILLNEQSLGHGLRSSFRFERAIVLDSVDLVVSGKMSVGGIDQKRDDVQRLNPLAWLAAPLFRSDAAEMLAHLSHLLAAAEEQTLPAWYAHLHSRPEPAWERQLSALGKVRHLLSSILMPSLDRSVVLHFRYVAHRRMAATALAIRLYELDHGQRPRTLETLVPAFLPAVPADPMSSNGLIQYLPDADMPRLYSVGENGVDDGGAYILGRFGRIDYANADVPFFLDGPRPNEATEASPATGRTGD